MKSCPFCKAPVKRKTIEHIHRWGGRLYLSKNVQAEVCGQCGETFLKPAVLRLMDRCTATGKNRASASEHSRYQFACQSQRLTNAFVLAAVACFPSSFVRNAISY